MSKCTLQYYKTERHSYVPYWITKKTGDGVGDTRRFRSLLSFHLLQLVFEGADFELRLCEKFFKGN